jgi:hypothetical protein
MHNRPVSEEKRTAARIETSISCDVATDSTSFTAEVLNLSLTGAALLGPVGVAKRGDLVTLMIDHQEAMVSIALSAEVVRTATQGEAVVYGVHFEALPPDARSELVMLLRLIAAGRGANRRQSPRVSRRVGGDLWHPRLVFARCSMICLAVAFRCDAPES